jgi:hypothetical protein
MRTLAPGRSGPAGVEARSVFLEKGYFDEASFSICLDCRDRHDCRRLRLPTYTAQEHAETRNGVRHVQRHYENAARSREEALSGEREESRPCWGGSATATPTRAVGNGLCAVPRAAERHAERSLQGIPQPILARPRTSEPLGVGFHRRLARRGDLLDDPTVHVGEHLRHQLVAAGILPKGNREAGRVKQP